MENNQSNNTIWVIIIILFLAGVAAWWLLQEDSTDNSAMINEEGGAMMEEENVEGTMMMQEDSEVPEGVMMEESGAMMEAADELFAGTYEAYSADKLAMANEGDVVLFFHATWCPTCRAADASFKTAGVQDGLAILKLNFDTETELRKKYGVTTQHTFVQVDAEGNLIKKWTGSGTAAAVAGQVM